MSTAPCSSTTARASGLATACSATRPGRVVASQTPADFAMVEKPIPDPPDVARYRFTDFSDVAFPTRGGGLLGLRPIAFYNTSTDLMAINDTLPGYMARYKSIGIPMAMLYGRGDRLLDYRAQGEAMKIVCPALDLELVEGGHMLPMTQADRGVALVKRVAERQQGMQAA